MKRSGPSEVDLLIVGQEPGVDEEKGGQPFIGRSGKLLRDLITRAGLDKYKIGFTNTVRCGTMKSTPKDIKHCQPFLWADIEDAKPKLVVPVGAIALRGVLNRTNITDMHGQIYYKEGLTVLPTYHPAFALRDPAQQPEILKDLNQAKEFLDKLTGGTGRIAELENRYEMPQTEEELWDALSRIEDPKHPFLAYDTEFYPLEWLDTETICYAVIFSYKPRHAIVLLVDHPEAPWSKETREQLKARISTILRTRPLVPHHAEPDVMVGWKCFGVHPDEMYILFDSYRGSYTLHGPDAAHGLKPLSYTSDADTGGYHLDLEKYRDDNKITDYGQIPAHFYKVYGGGDGDTTYQLTRAYIPRIQAQGSEIFYYDVLKDGYLLDIEMRRNGLLIDQDELAWRIKWFEGEKEKCYAEARSIPIIDRFATEHEASKKGAKFTFKSGPQMRRLLFDLLGVTPSSIKTDKGEASLDKTSLQEMILTADEESDGGKFLKILHRANQVTTMLANQMGPILSNIWPDGKLHADFSRRAASSRRRTKFPNVQNLTGGRGRGWDGPEDKNPWNLRMLVKARDGHKFLYPDFSQLEFRLAACYSKDKNMIDGCRPKPFDAHTMVAKEFGIDRDTAKVFNFALIYDATADRLQTEIFESTGQVWSLDRCEEIRDGLRQKYSDLFLLKDAYTDFMRRTGYIQTPIFGHRRPLPKAQQGDEAAIREGWNHLMQSMGHCLLDMVMLALYRKIRESGSAWFLGNDKHDGFLLEVPDAEIPDAARLCSSLMRDIPKDVLGDWMVVPIEGEIAIGTHFGNLTEYKIT